MKYYDSIAEGYNELHGEEQRKKFKIITDNIKVETNDKLLDVGCGTGLSKEFFDCDWTGIDPSSELLKKSKGKVIEASAEKIPFPDNSFDIIICVSSFHNFSDPEKCLKEMIRVGKNNFVITVLKKSKEFNVLVGLIKNNFKVENIEGDQHDLIYFCKRLNS